MLLQNGFMIDLLEIMLGYKFIRGLQCFYYGILYKIITYELLQYVKLYSNVTRGDHLNFESEYTEFPELLKYL